MGCSRNGLLNGGSGVFTLPLGVPANKRLHLSGAVFLKEASQLSNRTFIARR